MKPRKRNYAHNTKLLFLKSVLDVWTKRNHKLLHIGLHSPVEPSYFWDLGFDVCYLAFSQEDLEERQRINGKKIDYYLGSLEHLPFHDKVFDYSFLAHNFATYKKLEDKEKEEKSLLILDELVRVSAQGICLLENNSLSISRVKPCMSSISFQQLEKYLPESASAEFYSALYTPSFLWTKKLHLKAINAYPLKIPFGSIMALRIATSGVPLTTIPIKTMQTASEIV